LLINIIYKIPVCAIINTIKLYNYFPKPFSPENHTLKRRIMLRTYLGGEYSVRIEIADIL